MATNTMGIGGILPLTHVYVHAESDKWQDRNISATILCAVIPVRSVAVKRRNIRGSQDVPPYFLRGHAEVARRVSVAGRLRQGHQEARRRNIVPAHSFEGVKSPSSTSLRRATPPYTSLHRDTGALALDPGIFAGGTS